MSLPSGESLEGIRKRLSVFFAVPPPVPILLATLALLAGVEGATRLYVIVCVVVAFSVVVQGTSIPFVAATLGVPIRTVEPEPWNISIRLRNEPRGASSSLPAHAPTVQ